MVKKIQNSPKKIAATIGVFLIVGMVLLGLIYFLTPEQRLDEEINLFWWGNATHPPVLADNFEKEFGVKVNVFDFSSEGNMIEVLKSGNIDYDLVGVTDIGINELIAAGLVAPMNTNNIPNAKNLVEECSGRSYNSEEFYMSPIMWLTNGLTFNTKYIPEDTDSWEVLWNPEYIGKIALMDNRNDVFQIALQFIGYPVFAQNRFQIIEAKKFLLDQKPLLRGYENQYSLIDGLVSEDLWAAHQSSSSAIIAMSSNPNLKYVIPKEGSAFVSLGFAIPSTSKKKHTAEAFINYAMKPENNAATAYFAFVAPCRDTAKEFLNKEFLNNPVIYPPKETIKNLDSPANYEVTDEIIIEMEDIWQELNEEILI